LTGSMVASVLLFVCLVSSGSPVLAQEIARPHRNRVPFARAGLFFGRTGIAEGPGAYLEINPLRWLGICATVSHSRTTAGIDGGNARISDLSAAGCVTAHLPEMKGFLISPFVQLAYQSQHNRIVLLLDDGTSHRGGNDQTHRVWTVGPSVDRAIMKNGPRWAVRIGRNFGDGPSAKNADGLYFVGGLIFPLDHPIELGRSLRRIVRRKRPAADSTAANP
jgi:hypothetical protein